MMGIGPDGSFRHLNKSVTHNAWLMQNKSEQIIIRNQRNEKSYHAKGKLHRGRTFEWWEWDEGNTRVLLSSLALLDRHLLQDRMKTEGAHAAHGVCTVML